MSVVCVENGNITSCGRLVGEEVRSRLVVREEQVSLVELSIELR